jgi:hypothetical protein
LSTIIERESRVIGEAVVDGDRWRRQAAGTRAPRNHVSDLRGVTSLAVDATSRLVAMVEAIHVDMVEW